MTRPGTEDLEGQRATHRPYTQESSLTGMDTDHLGAQFVAWPLNHWALGSPFNRRWLSFSQWAAIGLCDGQFFLVSIPISSPLNAGNRTCLCGNQKIPDTFPATPGMQTAVSLRTLPSPQFCASVFLESSGQIGGARCRDC